MTERNLRASLEDILRRLDALDLKLVAELDGLRRGGGVYCSADTPKDTGASRNTLMHVPQPSRARHHGENQ